MKATGWHTDELLSGVESHESKIGCKSLRQSHYDRKARLDTVIVLYFPCETGSITIAVTQVKIFITFLRLFRIHEGSDLGRQGSWKNSFQVSPKKVISLVSKNSCTRYVQIYDSAIVLLLNWNNENGNAIVGPILDNNFIIETFFVSQLRVNLCVQFFIILYLVQIVDV